MKPNREIQRVIDGIQKNLERKSWSCLAPGCSNAAIQSHLLQRNGVLSTIAVDDHVYEFRIKGAFQLKPDDYSEVRRRGIRVSFTQPLFCTSHDGKLFAEIESATIDFQSYRSKLLFSYRSVCSELRKKERLMELETRIRNSKTLAGIWDQDISDSSLFGLALGVSDMNILKEAIETDLDSGSQSFEFTTLSYPQIGLCASALFSPTTASTDVLQKAPFSSTIINLVPKDTELHVIVGHHQNYSNDWNRSYAKSWEGLSQVDLEQNITDLLVTRVESWCISPLLYKTLAPPRIQNLLDYWNQHMSDLSADQTPGFNLFR